MSEFFLVHQDPAVSQAIRDAIAGNPGFRLVGQTMSGTEMLSKIGSSGAKVLLLQIRLPDGDGFSYISQLQARVPGIYVVPILQGNEAGDVWQRVLQLNLRDVLLPPFTPQNISQLLQQAAQHVHQGAAFGPGTSDSQESYVVAVASARSGVGKTLFATNLAIAMVRHSAQVALLDYSMNAGDFFTMLDQVPRNTMADAIAQGLSLDGALLTNLLADHSLGFKFLACPNEDFDFYGFDIDQARNLLKELRKLSEYVVVDTGAYDLAPTTAAVQEADLVYLVTTRDLARLISLQRWLKGVTSQDIPPERFRIIVNHSEVGSELKEEEIEEILGHAVTAYLPSCAAEVTYSINSGKPMNQVRSEHPLSVVIDKLAEYTVARWAESA